jgi:hypothetical protein
MRQRCLQLGADQVFDKSGEIEALIDYCNRLALLLSAAAVSGSGSGNASPPLPN